MNCPRCGAEMLTFEQAGTYHCLMCNYSSVEDRDPDTDDCAAQGGDSPD